MSYQVPQYIDKNKIFIVNRSEIEGRLDPSIYRCAFKFISNIYPNVRLSDVAYINPKVSLNNMRNDDFISFIPMENIDEQNGEVVKCDSLRVQETKGYVKFIENDLLWAKITPCMQNGKSAIARNLINGVGCGSTEFYIVRPKNEAILIEYIHFLLHSNKILETAKNYFGGSAGQQRVPSFFLEHFSTPLPPLEVQKDIVKKIKEAKNLKKEKECEAQQLLDSIDDYLLKELGITMPNVNRGLENRIFFSSFSKIESNRIDPTYSLYLGKNASSTKYENISLRSIAHIVKGNTLSSSEIKRGDIPVIAGGQCSPYNHYKANYEGNVITVSASGAYAGYVWYHDYPIYATDCCVIFSKDESHFMTKYIFEVLKLQQKSIYKSQTGAAQPHIYAADLQMLNIPVISMEKQHEIVDYIADIRIHAKELQGEGKVILENVKREVERMIIGE